MYLSVKKAAIRLDVCRMTVYRLIESRQLPHSKIGNKIVIDERDIDKLVKRNRVVSNEEYVRMADLMLTKLEEASADRRRRMR